MNNQTGTPKANRLISQKSPYLLQHADNPVNWFPWEPQAFEKARQEDRPIFLSIGYSTCHWCHVMERESFKDTAVAALLNESFISIKVDREERPDIDHIYMSACQMMTGSGGWPLTVIMTPDKKPFLTGTYFPKASRFGHIGLIDLLSRVKNIWTDERQKLIRVADEVTGMLSQADMAPSDDALNPSVLHKAYEELQQLFDTEHGGFSSSPKFPTPHILLFLLNYWKSTSEEKALTMALQTLDAMRNGGIYDHIGFGFHRYSTDSDWHVPHFEKMLYDQAMLCLAYTEAYEITGEAVYRKTAEEVLAYVLRDMTSAEGVFFSAEDADSEGEEGRFYLWHYDEIYRELGHADAELVCRSFGIKKEGNFTDHLTGEVPGTNILHMTHDLQNSLAAMKAAMPDIEDRIKKALARLFEVRKSRVHPLKDDKILTDWNGLMIAAFAKAARVFKKPEYADAAARAADLILLHMRRPDGRLLHRYRDKEAAIPAFIDDYAFMTAGLIELYEASSIKHYIEAAVLLNNICISHFWDSSAGGFFFAPDDSEALPLRSKMVFDSAIPSGNSMALWNLFRLAEITGDTQLKTRAQETLQAFSDQVMQSPTAFTFFLHAFASGLDEKNTRSGQ